MARRITVQDLNRFNKAQLEGYITRTAKKANLDLRALEREKAARGSAAYRHIEKLEANGSPFIGINKKGEIYFKTFNEKKTKRSMLAQAKLIASFKAAKTHTPKGVQRAYEKSFRTYILRKAREAAQERAGRFDVSKAEILKEQRRIERMGTASWFNSVWGSLQKESIKKFQSETVAEMATLGYSAEEIERAVDDVGTDHSTQEYIEYLNELYAGEDGGFNPFVD